MLQSKSGQSAPISVHGFLVGVEIEEGTIDPEKVALRLAEGLTFMEGVGKVDVEHLGAIDVYDPSEETL